MVYILLSAVCFCLFHYSFPETKKDFLDFWIRGIPVKKSKKGILYITWEFIGTQFLQFSWVFILIALIPTNDSYKGFPDVDPGLLIFVVLLTILTEELIFRGIFLLTGFGILKIFGKDWSYALGLVSSVLFGLIHLTNYAEINLSAWLWITPQALSGLVYWWFAKRYSIGTSIYLHVVFDMAIILPWLLFIK